MSISIKYFQKAIFDAYYKRDSERGLEKTFMWFIEEVGELAHAIKENNKDNIVEEIADVFAWLVSIANLLSIDVESAIIKKYNHILEST